MIKRCATPWACDFVVLCLELRQGQRAVEAFVSQGLNGPVSHGPVSHSPVSHGRVPLALGHATLPLPSQWQCHCHDKGQTPRHAVPL